MQGLHVFSVTTLATDALPLAHLLLPLAAGPPPQAVVAVVDGWVRAMSFDCRSVQGDLGTLYAADESGGIIRILPDAQWDEKAQRCVPEGPGSAVCCFDGGRRAGSL